MPWERKVMTDTAQLLLADEPESIRPLDILNVGAPTGWGRSDLGWGRPDRQRAQGWVVRSSSRRWVLSKPDRESV